MFQELFKEIKNHDTVIIHRHQTPDGDALGSQLGLKAILQENFPEKTVYVVGDDAGHYGFMDGAVMDEIADEVLELFLELDATDEQLDSPIIYCSGRDGTASLSAYEQGEDLTQLFETIVNYIELYYNSERLHSGINYSIPNQFFTLLSVH